MKTELTILSFSRESFWGLWNFGSKLLAANLLQTIYSNVSTSIIPKIASVKVSGFYYQASRLNGIPIGILQTTVDKAAFPILSKEKCISRAIKTEVYFNKLNEQTIKEYIKTGSPFDKAGGYGIQDKEFNLVKRIKGSLSNVLGLPLESLANDLL